MADSVLAVTVGRDGKTQLWGFRLHGGRDLGEPLVVQRVAAGSPSDGELLPGDVLLKINGHDATSMSHNEAHDLIKSAGNTISLVVQRAGHGHVSANNATLPRKVGSLTGIPPVRKISDIMASPIENLPVTVFPPNEVLARQAALYNEEKLEREKEREAVTHQPYRTTPLVLPAAKVKREALPPQSYLQLQQSANLWNAANETTTTTSHPAVQAVNNNLLKEKLEAAANLIKTSSATTAAAEGPLDTPPKYQVVHKQFNSPMSLYSKENIEQTLSAQTGLLTAHDAVQGRAFDPRESETYRALMEAELKSHKQEVKQFKPAAQPKIQEQSVPFKVNVMGSPNEKIQQSYSFKRIMADVLGETDF